MQPLNLLMVLRSHLKLTLTIQPFKNMLKNHQLIFPLHPLLKKFAGPGTFGSVKDMDALQSQGLALGASAR